MNFLKKLTAPVAAAPATGLATVGLLASGGYALAHKAKLLPIVDLSDGRGWFDGEEDL